MKRIFKDRVVVVTGAAGGIGREIVRELLKRGAIVVAVDINPDSLRQLKKEMEKSGKIFTYDVDITDFDQVQKLADSVHEKIGKITYIFNNAGAVHRSLFIDTRVEVFRKVIDVNLWGATHITKAFIRDVIETKGAIEVTSSVAGFAPLYGRTFYSASKYALHGLFETLRSELRGTGVTVTIVTPGFTRTPFEQAALGADGKRRTRPRKKVGKYLTPQKVAKAIVRGIERKRRLVIISPVARLSYLLTRCCPVVYEYLMYRSVKDEFNKE